MKSLKALIVGVSKYSIVKNKDLLFCKNDIIEINNVLHKRLGITSNNIRTLGMEYEVRKDLFFKTFQEISDSIGDDDTFIFYFSGHGCICNNGVHYLVLSDELVSIQFVIDFIEGLNCKNKIVFIDCCFAGKFNVSDKQKINIKDIFSLFDRKGCAVLVSSSEYQESFSLPDSSISRFTSLLSEALRNEYIVRKGELSLRAISKYINLRMSILNKNYINCKQNPIFRSNILGDIYFNVKDYKSYIKKKVFQEHDDYIIYNVKSLHISIIKRYSVEVILKNKFSYCDISEISKEVFDIVKSVEVYNSEIGEDRLKGKDANIIWVYFGKDEIDMINGIYMCKTTWIDKYQEKDIWYSVNGKNKFFINGVHTETYDNYESLKSYISQNTITKEKAVYEVKEILTNMINISEEIISFYNEYENKKICEDNIFQIIDSRKKKMDECYNKVINLDFPPIEIKDWFDKCINLVSTIQNFGV
ncbi:caspase family protein, partial [Clostridioides difficile]